jgi:hypothetical protein
LYYIGIVPDDRGGVEEDREHEQGGGHPGRERDQPCNQWGPEPRTDSEPGGSRTSTTQ